MVVVMDTKIKSNITEIVKQKIELDDLKRQINEEIKNITEIVNS